MGASDGGPTPAAEKAAKVEEEAWQSVAARRRTKHAKQCLGLPRAGAGRPLPPPASTKELVLPQFRPPPGLPRPKPRRAAAKALEPPPAVKPPPGLESPEIHARGPSGVFAVCEALRKITERGAATSRGGIEATAKAMAAYPTEAEVQQSGVAALYRLSMGRTKSATADLVPLGAVRSVVDAMKAHLELPGLQREGCLVLAAATASSAEAQTEVAALGGINAALEALQAHRDAALVQEAGCRALKELAAYSPPNQEAILSQGGIPAALRAMQGHTSEEGVQEMGCGLLRNMAALNAECQECAVSRGAVDVIRDALKAHPGAARVQTAGCWALYCLSVQNVEVGHEVADYGGAWVAIKAMELHREVAKVQEAGCWVLKELSGPIAADRATLSASVSAVLRAMELYTMAPVPELQEAAQGALHGLAISDSEGWVQQICLGRRGRLSRPTSRRVLAAIQEATSASGEE